MAKAKSNTSLILEWLPGRYAVCRLDASAAVPAWAQRPLDAAEGNLVAGEVGPPTSKPVPSLLVIARTDRELSIVIDEANLGADLGASIDIQRGFVALRVAGTLEFSEVGILARLTAALAQASVPVFVVSTFETDVLLIHEPHKSATMQAIQATAQFKVPG